MIDVIVVGPAGRSENRIIVEHFGKVGKKEELKFREIQFETTLLKERNNKLEDRVTFGFNVAFGITAKNEAGVIGENNNVEAAIQFDDDVVVQDIPQSGTQDRTLRTTPFQFYLDRIDFSGTICEVGLDGARKEGRNMI